MLGCQAGGRCHLIPAPPPKGGCGKRIPPGLANARGKDPGYEAKPYLSHQHRRMLATWPLALPRGGRRYKIGDNSTYVCTSVSTGDMRRALPHMNCVSMPQVLESVGNLLGVGEHLEWERNLESQYDITFPKNFTACYSAKHVYCVGTMFPTRARNILPKEISASTNLSQQYKFEYSFLPTHHMVSSHLKARALS